MYCYYNDGLSKRLVEADYEVQTGEVLFPDVATSMQLTAAFTNYASSTNKESIKAQISALEGQQTSRRIREAILGIDNGWLANNQTQIASLRNQL